MRAAASRGGAVFRLGMAFAGPNQSTNFYGSDPSYVDLMQETFNRPEEKALLASISYDFAGLGVDGLSAIVNSVAGFEGKVDGGRSDRQEVDLTIDYRANEEGWLKSFWLRVRGSWYNDQSADQDATQVRVILRYDLPVIQQASSISGCMRSVSQTESTPCTRARMRSRPAPVSIDGFGSAVREPSGAWSNCMNTRFQNSMNRSPAGSPSGPPSGPNAGPRSMWISLQGPHGPTSPICQ